ncbi:MAG: hypothetical protein EBT03_10355 [Betaproteobacteria bacterium]|nr:hypothetical protein [Betaproteobacteria bacterium]NCA17336.1 hypothetical protein [Betaproteobacteria bacterium]
MRHPTIHLNGTAAEVLYNLHCEAYDALRRALSALEAASPNGRDFYPQGSHAIGEAMNEHGARVSRLLSVMRELDELRESIADAREERFKAS